MSLTAVLRRMGRGDITIHGFRLTVRDWCAEAAGNGFPREVCVHALAHSLPNKVEAAYRRGNLLEKRTGFIRIDIKHLPRMPDQASRRYRFGAADLSAHSE